MESTREIPCRANMPASTPAGLPVASKLEYEELARKKQREDRIKKGLGLDWNLQVHIDR